MVIEFSLLAAFAAMFCWGFGDFLIQKNVKKIGNLEALAFIGIIGGILLLPFVWGKINLIFTTGNIILLGALGIVTFIAAMFDFEALKEGKLSVIEVVLEIELPVTVLLGFVFLKEGLSAAQFAFIALAFAGILTMAIKSHHIKNLKKFLEKGVLIGVVGAIFMGVLDFLTGVSSRKIDPFIAIWAPYVIFSVICLLVIWKREGFSKFIKNGLKFKGAVSLMAIFDTAAWVFYAIAMRNNHIGITTAITESYPVIGLFLGLWVNKEHIMKHQFIGAALAIIASITLAFIIS